MTPGVGVHPDVLAETASSARLRLAAIVSGLREELNTTNGRAKNLKSQVARIRNPQAARLAEIREQLAAGETRAEELRKDSAVRPVVKMALRQNVLRHQSCSQGQHRTPMLGGTPIEF